MKKITTFLLLMIIHQCIMSQSVGIGTNTPNASAQLDVSSTTKGLLAPRMTFAQRNAIAAPAPGLLVYQTDLVAGFYYYNGASWVLFSTGSATNYWTASGTNIFNNNTGNVGIGIANPLSALHVHSPNNTFNSYLRLTHQASGTTFSDGAYMGLDGDNLLFNNSEPGVILFSNSGGSNRLVISSSGNVGVGVNPPAYKLDIGGRMRIRTGTVGSVSTSSGIWMEDYRTGTNRIFFGMQDSIHAGFYGGGAGDVGWDFNFNAKNGNIGIGVDNPTDKLHVKGVARFDATSSSLATIKLYGANPNDNSLIIFYNQFSAVNPSAFITYDGGNDRLLLACNAGNMSLNSTGLGISTSNPQAKLHVNGNTMIGSGSPASGYLLSVNGKMIAEEVRVELDGSWPDYVFDKNYDLLSLQQLEKFIQLKKHLPNIPSAKVIEQEGVDLGDMNRRLLEKIEELTLYIIRQDKKINSLDEQVQGLQVKHQ